MPVMQTVAALALLASPSAGFVLMPTSSAALGGVKTTPSNGGASGFTGQSAMPSSTSNYRGGRASSAMQMNLADRFLRVAKANLNSVLKNWEDPEKVLEQATEDMQKDLVKVRQSYAEVSSSQKRMGKAREHAEKLADEWYRRAQIALDKGDDNLAREALTRKQAEVDTINGLTQQMEIQESAISNLFEAMRQLESKIQEAKSKKDNLIARARTAATTTKVNDMLSNVGGTSGMEAFERMEAKVENLESTAEVSSQLTGTMDGGLEQQFRMLESGSAVDNELASMKMALNPSTKEAPAAGAGGAGEPASAASSPPPPPAAAADPAVDDELEKMRRDMAASASGSSPSSGPSA